ncbi:ABC transporter permease subunit [Mycobacterium sp. TNTM28]|uniref:ABC transporter permease subunit n=1 Tax=[Mycobacterium] fortunisiensis TaxID=2600579 RepID=A0ABS6KGV5_9MYCO|nr:ABC transporter permease subunit [[Mycobacterium] fortunisiensis]MBU9762796.1 ABC transporter permease subunit [[Mycobacterium] fortunisiensis]
MSALAALDAERIKLSTTRSPLWSVVGVAVLSLGVAAMQGTGAHHYAGLPPGKAALGVAIFGVPVLMVLSSMTMTGEYRSGLIRTTLLATPNRIQVLTAKAVVCAAFSSVCAVLMVLASVLVARMVADPVVGTQLSMANSVTWRVAGGFALYAALAAVLGVAVGGLLRFAAGAVAVLLLWPLVAEPLLGNLPGTGAQLGPWLPFANMFRFLQVDWLFLNYDMPWSEVTSLLYFLAWVVVAFVAAAVLLTRRDA